MLTRAPALPRRQLTSSVDIAPLLLTIATGSNDWRARPPLRPPVAARRPRGDLRRSGRAGPALGRPRHRRGRDRVLPRALRRVGAAPRGRGPHRSAAKYALYSNWRAGDVRDRGAATRTRELYEYSTAAGRLELDNRRGRSRHEEAMHRLLTEEALPRELRAPLPSALLDAQALRPRATSSRSRTPSTRRSRRRRASPRPPARAPRGADPALAGRLAAGPGPRRRRLRRAARPPPRRCHPAHADAPTGAVRSPRYGRGPVHETTPSVHLIARPALDPRRHARLPRGRRRRGLARPPARGGGRRRRTPASCWSSSAAAPATAAGSRGSTRTSRACATTAASISRTSSAAPTAACSSTRATRSRCATSRASSRTSSSATAPARRSARRACATFA